MLFRALPEILASNLENFDQTIYTVQHHRSNKNAIDNKHVLLVIGVNREAAGKAVSTFKITRCVLKFVFRLKTDSKPHSGHMLFFPGIVYSPFSLCLDFKNDARDNTSHSYRSKKASINVIYQ